MYRPRAAEFERFHAANPIIYSTLVDLAREWIRRSGRRRIGIKALIKRARWELALSTDDAQYLINNSWSPWYARLSPCRRRTCVTCSSCDPVRPTTGHHAMMVRQISPGRD
jgi:hypothetical protein